MSKTLYSFAHRIIYRKLFYLTIHYCHVSVNRVIIHLETVSVLCSLGVSGDETKDMLVTEGDSVTLDTGVAKQKDDLIVWSFGPENILVAKVNGKAGSSRLYGSITSRGKLDLQTGSLTITKTSTTDSGLYKLKISSKNRVSYKRFNVAVNGESF